MFGRDASRKDGTAVKVAILIPIGAAVMASGLVFGYLTGLEQAATQKEIGYQGAVQDIRKKLDESGIFMRPGEIRSLLGQVTGIGAGYIDIRVNSVLRVNPLDEQPPTERRIFVSANTKLVKAKAKTLAEAQAEKAALRESIKKYLADKAAGKDAESPPMPDQGSETAMTLSELGLGDNVMVNADHDILYAQSFLATDIKRIEMPMMPSPPQPPGPPPPS